MKKYHVYGIGNALVDNDYEIKESFLEKFQIKKNSHNLIDTAHRLKLLEDLQELDCARNCGGSAGNTIVTISQFGGKCYFSCRLGKDANGKYYQKELNKYNVANNYDHQSLPDGHTGTCFVLVTPDGHRSLQTHLGITETLSTKEINENAIIESEFIYIEGFIAAQPTAHQAALQIRNLAQLHGCKISLTLSDVFMTTQFRRELLQLLDAGIDLLFCNEAEALSFTNETNIYNALEKLRKFSKQVVITRSEKGSIVNDGQQTHEISAYQTTVIDTVGAGDMYAGTFLYAICHGYDVPTAAKMASFAAAKIINKFTARFTDQEFSQLRQEIQTEFNLEFA